MAKPSYAYQDPAIHVKFEREKRSKKPRCVECANYRVTMNTPYCIKVSELKPSCLLFKEME